MSYIVSEDKYHGMSYPMLGDGFPDWLYNAWAKVMCRRGYHLFDEVWCCIEEHYLHCDACYLRVDISNVKILEGSE